MESGDSNPTMSGPADYRIRVIGRVEPSWVARLGGMEVTGSIGPDGEVVTTLTGRVADQAAFSGLLSTLYGLHLPVLSAEFLGDKGRRESQGRPDDESNGSTQAHES